MKSIRSTRRASVTNASRLLCLLSTGAVLGACGGSDDPAAPAPAPVATKRVSIEFVATVGTTPVDCASTLEGLGTTAARARLTDLRFYVSNVHLLGANDAETPVTLDADDWQLTEGSNSVALVDLEDGNCTNGESLTAAKHVSISGTVPEGTYTGIGMTLGVPEALNHSDFATAKAPLNIQAMAWNWQGGRKHAKIEISPENPATAGTYTGGVNVYDASGAQTGTIDQFLLHLGATGCTGTNAAGYTCTSPNQKPFHLHAFDPTTQRISVDLQKLFANNRIDENRGGPAGCMSGPTDPECGIDAASGNVVGGVFKALADSEHGSGIFRAIAK
ncbi:MAG: MbnP family copper-binding protein [Lautropia sp.]